MEKDNILEMRNISIDYKLTKYSLRAVSSCNFDIKRGFITALVGESGSGKTTLASSIIHCISYPGVLSEGTISMRENADSDEITEIEKLGEKEMNALRWEKVSMVFQAAQSSFNPLMTIWEHFWETYHFHDATKKKEAVLARSKELLDYVKLDVDRVLTSYPHELSGGMKQRASIAFSLLLNPALIILDEPTTALDVITQRYIFEILKNINKTFGISMLLMTHDINVVAQFSDYVGVMYAGRIMEYGKTEEVFYNPKHPYTKGLLRATPSLSGDIKQLKPIEGNPPDLRELPSGCVFRVRCPFAKEVCANSEPENIDFGGRFSRCFFAKESHTWH